MTQNTVTVESQDPEKGFASRVESEKISGRQNRPKNVGNEEMKKVKGNRDPEKQSASKKRSDRSDQKRDRNENSRKSMTFRSSYREGQNTVR